MTRTPCKLGLNYTCLTTPESIAITSQFKDQTGHCTHVVYFQEYVYAAHLLRLQSDPECVLQVCDFRCSTVVFPEHHMLRSHAVRITIIEGNSARPLLQKCFPS